MLHFRQMENEDDFINQDEILEVIELADQGLNGTAVGEDDEADEDAEMDTASADSAIADQSMITFSKHMGDVFTVDVCPPFVACGGEDDRAYIWKVDDGNVVFECTGHSDSVTYVRFNAKKTMLATASMDGLVQIWRLEQFEKLTQFQVGDLSWLQWHQAADILFCGDEDGSVWMYLIPNGDCKVYAGYGHPCAVGELFPDGKRLCAGYADGGVRIWDLKTSTSITVDGASVHRRPVTSIDISHDSTLAASGSEEGTANLIHTTTGRIITSFVCTKGSGQRQQQRVDDQEEDEDAVSVEAIAFSKISPALFTGTVNGDMAIWDLNTHVVRQAFPTQEGIVKAVWMDQCVLVADLGGALRLYDSRNGALVKQWTGHKGAILDFTISNDSKILVSSSADHTCKIFNLEDSR